MFFSPEAYQVIDIADRNRHLAVVCEATGRAEVSDYLEAHGLAQCDVFKEYDEEIYRGVCPVTVVKSTEETGRGE